jgi:hypothetical protein
MSTVPMIAPDGSSGDIPKERAQDALNAGFKRAVVMHSPDGQQGYVPIDRAQEAINKGFKVGQNITELNTKEADANKYKGSAGAINFGDTVSGVVHKAGSLISGMVTGAPAALGPDRFKNAVDVIAQGATNVARTPNDQYTTPVEKGAMAVAPAVGVDAPKLADAARRRDVGGMIVEGGTPLAMAIAAPKVMGKVGELGGGVVDAAKSAIVPSELPQAKVMPSAANLPRLAQAGVEDVFRAAAPTGKNVGFRENLNVAAPDLADIARKVDVAEAKGGIINPDMRVRAVTEAIRDHLQEMYQTERAPQIARHATTPVEIAKNADSVRGLEYLENTAGQEQIRNLAAKALGEIEKGGRKPGQPLTMAEADTLAMAANQNLKAFERMTPEQKIQAVTTNPKIGGLKALDSELGQNMNKVLTDAGESGLRSYERRFAALSAVRDQLDTRVNATELKQEGVFGAVGRVTRPVMKVIKEGPSGVPSASQAATADVNVGRTLQRGLQKLKSSRISARVSTVGED